MNRTLAATGMLALALAVPAVAAARGTPTATKPVTTPDVAPGPPLFTQLLAIADPAVTEPAAPGKRRAVDRPEAPYFSTPEAAMRYLARAYNSANVRQLKNVTTPGSRAALDEMRRHAPRITLVGCVRDLGYSYTCTFRHTIRGASGQGMAQFVASPADRHGWYLELIGECG